MLTFLAIENLAEKESTKLPALVVRTTASYGSNGKPFATLSLARGKDIIEARMWDIGRTDELPQPDGVYLFEIQYSPSCDVSYEILSLEHQPEADPADYAPVSTPIGEMEEWIDRRILKMRVPLSSIATAMLERYGYGYRRSAAGRSMHHAYPGGLIEHSFNMARSAQMLSAIYPFDADLAVCGCLFHDIGKVIELDTRWSGQCRYTERGQLEGHPLIGCTMVRQVASDIGVATDDSDLLALVHILASHHGTKEHGAICEPMTAEALLVAKLDALDMEQGIFQELPDGFTGTSDEIPALGHRIAVI